MKNSLLLILVFCSVLAARQVPFLIRHVETPSDLAAINSNFKSIENDLAILEKTVLLQRSQCERDTPGKIGQLCFDTTDFKLYVATAITPVGFQVVGQQ